MFPDDIPDLDAQFAEMKVFFPNCDEEKAKKEDAFKLRDAADLAIRCHQKHELYPNVAKVYQLLLTSPPFVWKSERSLSRLKILKGYLRNTMSQDRLDALVLLYCRRDILDVTDIEHVVDRCASVRNRRVQIK